MFLKKTENLRTNSNQVLKDETSCIQYFPNCPETLQKYLIQQYVSLSVSSLSTKDKLHKHILLFLQNFQGHYF